MTVPRLARVVGWMVGALLSFSGLAISIRLLANHGFSIFEVLALRSGIALVLLSIILLTRPSVRATFRAQQMRLHLLRNIIHYISQYAWAVGITLLPLAMVFSLEFTMPAWTALLAVWALGERLTPSRIGVVVFGFIGVLVILRPGVSAINPGAFLVLGAAFGYAITMVTTKKLTATESTFSIVFWMMVIQFPISLAGSDWHAFLSLGRPDILPVMGVGIAGSASHFCLSNAFRAGDATLVVPLDFMRIPLIAVVGWAFFNESLDIFVFIGALIIISGVLWNLRTEARRSTVAEALDISD